jgi:hypothetical protein
MAMLPAKVSGAIVKVLAPVKVAPLTKAICAVT